MDVRLSWSLIKSSTSRSKAKTVLTAKGTDRGEGCCFLCTRYSSSDLILRNLVSVDPICSAVCCSADSRSQFSMSNPCSRCSKQAMSSVKGCTILNMESVQPNSCAHSKMLL